MSTTTREPARRSNHVVTASYLGWGFGKPRSQGRRAAVEMFDLRDGVRLPVRAERILIRNDFSVVRTSAGADDRLERAWSELESWVLPAMRGLNPLVNITDEETSALLVFVALHLARSLPMQRSAERSWITVRSTYPDQMANNDAVLSILRRDLERTPRPEEVQAIAAEFSDVIKRSNFFFVNHQIEEYNNILRYLSRLPVAVSRASRFNGGYLLTSDSPVLLLDPTRTLADTLGGAIKFGQEQLIIMPITKRSVISIGWQSLPPVLNPEIVRELNELQIGNAERFVVVHPDTDLERVAPDIANYSTRKR